MEPPRNVRVTDWDTSRFWFDEDGILYSVSKKGPKQTLEQVKRSMEDFKKVIGNGKVCMMVDVTNSPETSKEVRDYVAKEFPGIIKAIAMVSGSALGKMLANLFFSVKSQPYPVKMFNNEQEAKEWLKQYL